MIAIALTLLTIFLVVLLAVLGSAAPANAALPPQQNQELREAALFVVTGTIQHISKEEFEVSAGTDYHYRANVLIETVELSKISADYVSVSELEMPSALPSADSLIEIHYYQTGKRPAGWAGPSGQSAQLRTKLKARLFLTLQDGNLVLLEPNGWETLDL